MIDEQNKNSNPQNENFERKHKHKCNSQNNMSHNHEKNCKNNSCENDYKDERCCGKNDYKDEKCCDKNDTNCCDKGKDTNCCNGESECDCEKEKNISDKYFQQLLKLQAEFDNYRKRVQQDEKKAYNDGRTDAIVDFLPALDSFKMATDMITDKNTLMGIQYIEKGILATLEKMGVSVIDATGKFDPNLHQAIDTDSTADVESGYIVKECYKGFKMGDKVIRYSQVIVKK